MYQQSSFFVLGRALSKDEIDEVIRQTDQRRRLVSMDATDTFTHVEPFMTRVQDSAYNKERNIGGPPKINSRESESELSVPASDSSKGSTREAERRVLREDVVEVIEDVPSVQGHRYHSDVDSDQVSLGPDDSASQLSRSKERSKNASSSGKSDRDTQSVSRDGFNGVAGDSSTSKMAIKNEKLSEKHKELVKIVETPSQSIASLDIWDPWKPKRDKSKEKKKKSHEEPSGTGHTDLIKNHNDAAEVVEGYSTSKVKDKKKKKKEKEKDGVQHGRTNQNANTDDEWQVTKSSAPKKNKKHKKKDTNDAGIRGSQQAPNSPTTESDEELTNTSRLPEPGNGQENGERLDAERAFVLPARSRTTTVEDAEEDVYE